MPKSETIEKIRMAARLRAEGNSWKTIAERIDRENAESARQLPIEHPEHWKREIDSARADTLDEVRGKASETLLELLEPVKPKYGPDGEPVDGKFETRDERVRQSAAHSLMVNTGRQMIQISGKLEHEVGPTKSFAETIKDAIESVKGGD